MPRHKTIHSSPSKNSLDDLIENGVEKTSEANYARNSEPYDGVLGTLPSWIPGNFQEEFKAARNRLLEAGYTSKQIRDLMAQEKRRYRLALRNPDKPDYYGGFLWPPAVAKDVSLLAHFKTAVRLGPEKGLAFLTDQIHAQKINKGERYGKHQSRIAKQPRGRLVEEDRQTLDEVIGRLARQYPDETAAELWPHLYSKLEELGLSPDENDQSTKKRKWAYTYDFTEKRKSIYDFKEKRKSITFGSFENVVSQYRTGNKQLPRRKSR